MSGQRTGAHGTRIIGALESAWHEIQRRHPEIPDVVMITGSGMPRRGSMVKLGHHHAERWVDAAAQGRRPELFVAGETIAMGGTKVLETMLHEAAHALAFTRGRIKDTSSAGRWHNKRFAALAVELGLEPPKRAEPVLGFSTCAISAATVAVYAATIRKVDSATLPHLGKLPGEEADPEGEEEGEGGKKRTRGGRRTAVECGCTPEPRRLQVTPKAVEDGPIICGLCEQRFAVVEAPADDQAEQES
jgi:hypothetical protein